MKLQELRNKRVEIANKMKALVDKDGVWTPDNQASFSAMKLEVENIDNQISAIEEVLNLEAGRIINDQQTVKAHGVLPENAATLRNELLKAFLQNGREGVHALLSQPRFQNVQTEGSNAGGGYTVTREMWGSIVEAMKLVGGVRLVATPISTGTGGELDFVTTDATSEEGELLGEAVQSNGGDTSFGTAKLGAYKFSSKTVAVSLELLQDSSYDIEAYVVKLLGLRLGRATNRYFTLGTGVNQPQGIVTAAGIGKIGATGQVSSVTYDDLVDLEHSVDPIYRSSAQWMLHDQSVRKIKQLKDSQGRPLWLPGLAVKAPDTILNYGYVLNQHMATMAASAKSMLFGDLSKYLIRDVMEATLYRNTDSKYNEQGLVGFHAMQRADGAMIDTGGAVKAYQNSAS